jgi:HSP20 family protein
MVNPVGSAVPTAQPRRTQNCRTSNRVMKALSVWNPFREMEELLELRPLCELAEARPGLPGLFGRWPAWPESKETLMTEWLPRIDVMESEKEFLLKAELPEVKKEEFKVTVEKGILSITGERKLEKEEKGKKYHRIERAYGRFERSFALPEGTEAEGITSEFKEGVLTVHVPKKSEAKPKALEVKVE